MPEPSHPLAELREDFSDWTITSHSQETASGPPYIGYVAGKPGVKGLLSAHSVTAMRRQLEETDPR